MSRLGNLGKQCAVDAINDFFNVESSVCMTPRRSLTYPVSVVSGQLACECWQCVNDLRHDKTGE